MDLPTPGIPPERLVFTDPSAKTIAIVGAGSAGLVALKVILDTPQYKSGLWIPTAFEARDNVGGVWQPAPPTDDPPLTPLYDSLTTNLPHPLMMFSDYPFPPSTPLFPKAAVVQTYLESFAEHFHLFPHIKLNTAVRTVERQSSRWNVTLSSGETHPFDLVIVCNGHYRIPRYPNIPGLAQWLNDRKAIHSAWYRHPYNAGDTVLVVGAGPSGQDISAEMATVTKTVVHSVSGAPAEDIGPIKRRGRVIRFGEGGKVEFEDGSVEYSIDYCILATGYETSFPFLSSDLIQSSLPPPIPPLPRDLYNTTYGVFPLGKHIFPIQSHFPINSIAFLGLLVRVSPFPLVEVQARAVLHAFANHDALDPMGESVDIISRNEELRAEVGGNIEAIAKAWHRFQPLEQFTYRDALNKFADSGFLNSVPVQPWEKEMYMHKDVLRKVWRQLEADGTAEDWVRGVGEGGPHEWVELMRKLVKKAEEEHVLVEDVDQAKL